MEKFFLKRLKIVIETWQLGLFVIVAVIGLIGFGALVEYGASDGNRAPGIANAALRIARIPADSREVMKAAFSNAHPAQAAAQRFEGMAGFKRLKTSEDETLLLARYDGDRKQSVVEIIDLENGAILHRYEPDFREILGRSNLEVGIAGFTQHKNSQTFTISHPLLANEGGLVFHGMNTPLTKIDACSNIVWMIDKLFHHSLERDADGNFWSSVYIDPPKVPRVPRNWHDDAVIKISPEGEVLYEKSVGEILLENNLKYLVYSGGRYSEDPLHLNDVQPVMTDGPHWQRGDLFLSLRHPSAIVLYRPSTNKVLWLRQGPWTMQHDVDIVNDHQIAIFDNNAGNFTWGQAVLGVNDTMIYDFSDGEIKNPFSGAYEVNDIRTITEGLSEILPDGEIFVEEQNYGRLLKMNAAGEITWQYVNRASDGTNYIVNWSRYIDATLADQTATLAAEKCSGQNIGR